MPTRAVWRWPRRGSPRTPSWWGYRIAPGEGVAGLALQTGEPAVTNDYQGGGAGAPGLPARQRPHGAVGADVLERRPARGALGRVPLGAAGRAGRRGDARGDREPRGGGLCQRRGVEKATEAARTDSLTGLLNHGAVQIRTSEEIWRAQRSERPLACLLADLDDFKPINDRHGHLIGDEILKRVATALAEEFRPYDGVARYGGDEFVVMLPDSDEADALGAAERLRACVARAADNFTDLGLPVGASVGVAQWTEPQTAAELLDRADRALLLAKRRGRGTIVVASARAELELAELEGGQAPSEFMNEFWDTVAGCEEPREVLFVLPAFLLRQLGLEEVALFDSPHDSPGGELARLSHARMPGDPGAVSFGADSLPSGAEVMRRVGAGSISRGSRAELGERSASSPAATHPRCRAAPTPPWEWRGPARATACSCCVTPPPSSRSPCLRLVQIVAGQTVTVLAGQGGSGSRGAVAALAAAIDARDNYTLSHSKEVVELAAAVAERLGLSGAEIAQVRDGAMLHDVGKVAIPNEVLNKQGPLSEAEWKVMRRAPGDR